ncbi:hypothetical protein ROZALSC1DRAFT_28623 [Rozella allomycis CSF55]|uniref:superoxide dismutase n=1 Tax=Rozella allomycis (strain CSF55) TaxID=988480 RepID=A0A075AMW8_ROZAC|nr:Tetratricopeptide-like helical domain-containing protein [Rozella allomycis CSF55]RKP19821.1 hypothetical protein ROZALSC1DRAFT_28623 [Rozella allomycis CSF55]|eukprot:EPZ31056.1 Tetratricopeptide-like helical domain-containing protein [Rozella allomycis CSF55]
MSVEINPKYHLAYFNMANLYFSQLQYEVALENYNKCLEIVPKDEESLLNRAITFAALKNYQDSLSDFNAVLALNPNNPHVFFNRAQVYQKLGIIHKKFHIGMFYFAELDYKRVLEYMPQDQMTMMRLGDTFGFDINNPGRSMFKRLQFAKKLARTKYTLPDLSYDYNALEPYISAEIMQLHHQKHHQTYVTNLNNAMDKLSTAFTKENLESQISLQQAIKFNGGGHINHTIFWTNLAGKRNGGGELANSILIFLILIDDLKAAIEKQFGSVDQFKTAFNNHAVSVQGSGWAWLGFKTDSKTLQIATTANQDPLQSTTGLVPLLGCDVWEHAYYLQYKNVRPEYLKSFWEVVNWKNVTQRYHDAVQKV